MGEITKLRSLVARVARRAWRMLRGRERDLFAELDDAAIALEAAIDLAQHGAGSHPVARARRALEGLVAAEGDLGQLAAPARRLIDIAGDAEAAAAADDRRALVDARQAAGDARLGLALASQASAGEVGIDKPGGAA